MDKLSFGTLPWQAVLLCAAAVSCFDPDATPHGVGQDLVNKHLTDANGDAWGVAVLEKNGALHLRLVRFEDYFHFQFNKERCIELPMSVVRQWLVAIPGLGNADFLPGCPQLEKFAGKHTKLTNTIDSLEAELSVANAKIEELEKAAKAHATKKDAPAATEKTDVAKVAEEAPAKPKRKRGTKKDAPAA